MIAETGRQKEKVPFRDPFQQMLRDLYAHRASLAALSTCGRNLLKIQLQDGFDKSLYKGNRWGSWQTSLEPGRTRHQIGSCTVMTYLALRCSPLAQVKAVAAHVEQLKRNRHGKKIYIEFRGIPSSNLRSRPIQMRSHPVF